MEEDELLAHHCKYFNSDIPSEIIKKSDLKPKMAKRLDVKTTNGSRVTPKTAGIESTANAMSLSSITATVRSKGVACPKCLIPSTPHQDLL